MMDFEKSKHIFEMYTRASAALEELDGLAALTTPADGRNYSRADAAKTLLEQLVADLEDALKA